MNVTRQDTTAVNSKRNQNCGPCQIDNKQEKASCFCLSCDEFLCRACRNDHQQFKVTRTHILINESDYPSDISTLEELVKLTQCSVHSQHELQFKCMTDNAFICSICAITTHRNCKELIHIGKLNHKTTTEWQECISKLNASKEWLEMVIRRKISEAGQLDSFSIKMHSNMKALNETMTYTIKTLQSEFVLKYQSKTSNVQNKITRQILELVAILDKVGKAEELAETAFKWGSPVEKAAVVEILQDLQKMENVCSQRETNSHIEDLISFVTGSMNALCTKLQRWMNDLSSFSYRAQEIPTEEEQQVPTCSSSDSKDKQDFIKVMDKTDKNKPIGAVSENATTQKDATANAYRNEKPPPFLCTARQLSENDISVPDHSNKVCSHVGCLILRNGDIIFLDQNNKTVKTTNAKFKYKCHRIMQFEPLDVLEVKTNIIGVANSHAISVLSVSNNGLQRLHEFLIKSVYILLSVCSCETGIAMLQRWRANDKLTNIQLRTVQNKIVDTILPSSEATESVPRLEHPTLIRSTSTSEFLIGEKTQLTKINKQGKFIDSFKHDGLKSFTYFTFDQRGNILLCDRLAGNIYLVSADLATFRLLICNIEAPASLAFNAGNKTLIVGCLNKNSVLVYQLM